MPSEGATPALEAPHPALKAQPVATGPWRGHFLSEASLDFSQPRHEARSGGTEAAEWHAWRLGLS